jgi:hypothetical protein
VYAAVALAHRAVRVLVAAAVHRAEALAAGIQALAGEDNYLALINKSNIH